MAASSKNTDIRITCQALLEQQHQPALVLLSSQAFLEAIQRATTIGGRDQKLHQQLASTAIRFVQVLLSKLWENPVFPPIIIL